MFNFFKRSNSSQPKPTTIDTTPQRNTHNPQFYSTDVRLREHFAEELFNLEMDVESEDVTMETVTELLNLYKEAVEYFEAIQSNKFMIFKNKIQSLFTKKNVVLAMKLNALQQNKEKQAIDSKKLIDEQRQSELKIKLKYISQQDQKSSAKDLINQHSIDTEKINTMINKDLEDQNEVLQKRLQQRRNSCTKKDPQLCMSERKLVEYKPIDFNPTHTPTIKTQQKTYTNRGRVNNNNQND